jgi:hypothetical protein
LGSDVMAFDEIDRTQVALVGGKDANLGELSRIAGIRVPAGFCVTTDAYRRADILVGVRRSRHRGGRIGRHTPTTARSAPR